MTVYGQQTTPHHHQSDSLPVASVGSPASVAPSPLPNPQSQPASVPPADPTMPTLSPQPPPPHHHPPAPSPLEDKADVHFHGPKSVSSINQVGTVGLRVGNKTLDVFACAFAQYLHWTSHLYLTHTLYLSAGFLTVPVCSECGRGEGIGQRGRT